MERTSAAVSNRLLRKSVFNKGEDIQNAISFLGTLKCVNKDSIGTLGICAGGSYVIHASVSDRRVKALATVNGFLSLSIWATNNSRSSQ